MEWNPIACSFELKPEDTTLMLRNEPVTEEESFDFMMKAIDETQQRRMSRSIMKYLQKDCSITSLNAALQNRIDRIDEEIETLNGIVCVLGETISLEASLQEIEDAANQRPR